jgi:hypothetical protein
MVKIERARAAEVEPLVVCSVSSEDKMIRCSGLSHTFNCSVVPHIDELRGVELRIQDLDLFHAEGEVDIVRLIAPRSKVTAVHPETKQDISIALWAKQAKSERLIGFEVVDSQCWTQVNSLASDLKSEELRVSLRI